MKSGEGVSTGHSNSTTDWAGGFAGLLELFRQLEEGGDHGRNRPRRRRGDAHTSIRDYVSARVPRHHDAGRGAGVVDKAVTAASQGAKDKTQMGEVNVARGCLEGVREAVAEMMN